MMTMNVLVSKSCGIFRKYTPYFFFHNMKNDKFTKFSLNLNTIPRKNISNNIITSRNKMKHRYWPYKNSISYCKNYTIECNNSNGERKIMDKTEWAYRILSNKTCYKNTIFTFEKKGHLDLELYYSTDIKNHVCNIASYDLEKQISTFKEISDLGVKYKLSFENEIFDLLYISLVSSIPLMNDHQILMVMSSLQFWHIDVLNTNSKGLNLLIELDVILSAERKNKNLAELFRTFDYFYQFGYAKMSIFCYNISNDVSSYVEALTPSQLVQYLFYSVVMKDPLYLKYTSGLSRHLCKIIKHISPDEIAIILLGLRSSKKLLDNYALIDGIIIKLQSNWETMSNVSLKIILEYFSDVYSPKFSSQIDNLVKALLTQVNNIDYECLLKLGHLCTKSYILDEKIIHNILDYSKHNINDLKLEDFYHTLQILHYYDLSSEETNEFFDLICKKLECASSLSSINREPKLFVKIVLCLVRLNYCSEALISACLQPSMTPLFYYSDTATNTGKCVLEIDVAVSIQKGNEYQGYQLDGRDRTFIYNTVKKESISRFKKPEPALQDNEEVTDDKHKRKEKNDLILIWNELSSLFGSYDFVQPIHILPYNTRPDLVFCTNDDGELQSIPDSYMNSVVNYVQYTTRDLCWNAVVLPIKHTSLHQTKMNIRLLNKLGYNVCLLPPSLGKEDPDIIRETLIDVLESSSSVSFNNKITNINK